jgi:hypothetical protein
MTTYNGQALVIVGDGIEISATVSLRSYRDGLHMAWGGTVTPAPDSHQPLLNLTEGRLRLPEGVEAAFLRPDTSDLVRSSRMEIIGQDEPPF